MQRMRISISTINDAFQHGNEGHEIARILRELADKIEQLGRGPRGTETWVLRDVNGNTAGTVRV